MPNIPDNLSDPCRPLPKHKIAILTFIGLLAPVYFVPQLLSSLFPDQTLIVTGLAVGLIVFLMTYAIMPLLKWVFRGWLKQMH